MPENLLAPAWRARRRAKKALIYRERPDDNGELAFAPPKVAEYVSAVHNAMQAKTRGEFKARIPPKDINISQDSAGWRNRAGQVAIRRQ